MCLFFPSFFKQNPKPFCLLAKELYPGQFDGTTCHYFIRLLHEKGLLLRNFSQNIDTIELVAGIPEEKLVFAHGSFQAAHCIGCRKEYTPQWVKTEIFADKIPRCTCGSLVKPDIVFFGEGLPPRFFELMSTDFAKCDLLIIMGTSLTVQPFASLIHKVRDEVPRLLINREKVGEVNPALAGFVKGLNFGPSGYRGTHSCVFLV
jgi:NAD-dependent deacetylase sirtuin 2